jgi:hypothetical protein
MVDCDGQELFRFLRADGDGDQVWVGGGFSVHAGVRLYRIGAARPKVRLGLPVVIESSGLPKVRLGLPVVIESSASCSN